MQKFLILLCAVLMFVPLVSAQRFVVGEVFTATW